MCTVRSMAPSDPVNHPSHYTRTSLETIDVIEDMVKGWPSASAYRLGNVLKYIWRHRDKGDPKENLKKALWYLQRELDALEPPKVVEAVTPAQKCATPTCSRPAVPWWERCGVCTNEKLLVKVAKPLEQRSVVVEPLPPEQHNGVREQRSVSAARSSVIIGSKVQHRNLPLHGVGEVRARGLDGLLDVEFPLRRRWVHEDDLELA